MLTYPNIDPVAVSLGSLKVHWYGLMYIFGFAGAWFLGRYRAKRLDFKLSPDQVDDIIFYIAIGVVLGGRIGYTLFYNLPMFLDNPISILKVWEGGMSFHGGAAGGYITAWMYGNKNGFSFFQLSDFYTPLVPIGLLTGRIGNFINGELWGSVSNMPWAMVFPGAGPLPRHPSQLYEAFFEGIVLFCILTIYLRKPRPRMAPTGMALLFYGLFRFFIEFVRLPDAHLGYLAFNWLTMGQVLTIPMIIIGFCLIFFAYKRQSH